jgi:hypothetical protein
MKTMPVVLIACLCANLLLPATPARAGKDIFAHDNLVPWCIVPFDAKKRGPEERAAMLEKLGFKHFAYDWRAEHVPTFAAEIEALKKHGVERFGARTRRRSNFSRSSA